MNIVGSARPRLMPDPCDADEPFGAHATEVSTAMRTERAFRIEHNRTLRPAPEDYPMPEWTAAYLMPLNREQREIGQSLPRHESGFSPSSTNVILTQQPSNVAGVGPQLWILGENAQSIGHTSSLTIGHAGHRRHTGNPTPGPLLLNNWLHRRSAFLVCSTDPLSRYSCQEVSVCSNCCEMRTHAPPHLDTRRSPIP